MTETEHYKLKKPAGNEYVSPGPFNDNADILDAALHELEEKTGNLDYVPNSEKGAPNGVATLGAEGTIPPEQIPGGTADAAVEAHNTSEDPHANCGFIRAGAGEPAPPVPVNADLLEGHDAAYFEGLVDAAKLLLSGQISDVDSRVDQVVADGVKIATGSYTGTGTYGSSNPCSLTFSFVPKLVMVQQENSGYFPSFRTFYGETTINGYQGYSATQPLDGIWNNKTLSWYSARSAEYQFNYNGRKYNYIAFG